MKRFFKTIFVLVLILFTQKIIFAQDLEKTVEIVVSGSGKTQDAAKEIALRSAIEQAFGVFISSKTEILNDNLVSDQITSITSGNIKSYQVLNESQLPNGSWAVNLKTIVSIDKLTSFVKSKGVEVEIKGSLFALNIKQQIINEHAEMKAINEMITLLHEPMQISFDYTIKSNDPKSSDENNQNWEIPLQVSAKTNKNIDFCANYFMKTLSGISLSNNEVESYKSLNKEVFELKFKYAGQSKIFYLRKEASRNAIQNYLALKWSFYVSLFKVSSSVDEFNGFDYQYTMRNENTEYRNNISDLYGFWDYSNKEINFPNSNQIVGVFNLEDNRTLSEIEKINGYQVIPRGVVSQIKHGGIVVYEENGHGLVMSNFCLGEQDWLSAKTTCEELDLNGYYDWHLPSKDELYKLYQNLNKIGLSVYYWDKYFWSNTEHDSEITAQKNDDACVISLSYLFSGIDGNKHYLTREAEYRIFQMEAKTSVNYIIAFRNF